MSKLFNCSNCRFYQPNGDGQGECRRHPPQMVFQPQVAKISRSVAMNTLSAWPPTQSGKWCGDHEPEIGGV